ncbi:hypothetical protein CUR178_00977 [Leishmania enriettii]|uniref:Uncharacterized protein n=1 Tax=Leishmania enriettii TaxID=5663 RepID=A0A836GYY6_LEIEN|nr:hypothetical protein CUR178_00977 [Leishmania enriettii]
MPPPASTAQAGAGQGAPLAASPPANATTITFPNVSVPLRPPGHPLPSSAAEIEASTAVYFREGRNPYGKRHRSAFTHEASESAVSTVLEIVSAEEDERAAVNEKEKDGFLRGAPPSQLSTAAAVRDAATARYLAQLFNEPARCEQDVYRLVDVAHCRRVLAEEADEFRMAISSYPPTGSSLEGSEAATARAKRVDEFNSCLTAGQHRRYRGFVLEWLRHQPSLSAPPNSVEVLKVVQQEQRLYLEALRREAVCHVMQLSPGRHTTAYTHLGSVLTSFAQYRRVRQMRQRLIFFLDDAKAKETEGRLLLGRAPASIASAASGAAEDDTGRRDSAHGSTDDAQRDALHAVTPLQLFQRRFPSLRVLQWHMVRLYNAQQSGVVSSFPNPQVRSFATLAGAADGARPHNRTLEADSTLKASSAAAAHPPSVTLMPASTTLLLTSLPQHSQGDDVDRSDARDGGEVSENGCSSDREASSAAPTFAAHLCADAATATAANLTPLSTAALHAYVAYHLLPRLGWQVSKYQGKEGEPSVDDAGSTAVVVSVSLSIAFEAMLKLFVAHVDIEEPRTSFRIPICVHVMRKPDLSRADSITPARGVYHAHVTVGAPMPNVTESRQSIQVAAAEYLIYRAAKGEGSRSDVAAPRDAGSLPSTCMATKAAAPNAATVHLSRSTAMPRDIKARQSTAQSVTGGAGGSAISASVESLLEQQEPTSEVAPSLVFRVALPVAETLSTAPDNEPLPTASPVLIMAKMEHLNLTSAVAPNSRSSSLTASPSAADSECAVASLAETAAPCRWLLEMLSPREMLQLDLLFACFPTATVQLHRVQLSESAEKNEPAEQRGNTEGEHERLCMQVLAIERLTLESWCLSRRCLQKRPAESLTTTPSPAEVLATYSWDLLYDTLAWLLDTTARRVAYALETEEGCVEVSADGTADAAEGRYMYLILSNHANLVNTSASTKLYTKKRPENAPESAGTTAVTCSYTESRFAVRYVVQDATEIYPDYASKVPILVEAANLRFLERDTQSGSGEDDEGTNPAREKETGASKVGSRLYRDPHTWNAESIPFTFAREPASALAPTRS